MSAAIDAMGESGISDQRAESLQGLWRSLHLVCTAWRTQANRMAADYGLSSPQFIVFTVLSAGEPLTMGQIGDQSNLPTSSLTALVDRLVELGFASREAHPSDRRAIQVQLTESGHDLARKVTADTMRATAQITSSLSDHQIDDTTDAIQHLLTGYHQYVAKAGRVQVRQPARRASIDRLTRPDNESQLQRDGSPRLDGRALHDDPTTPDSNAPFP